LNILLTGGTGYIGSHTAIKLLDQGHSVVLFDNLTNSKKSVIRKLERITQSHFEFVYGDISDKELLRETCLKYNIQCVIHLAGFKAVGESVDNPIKYYINNVTGTICLLEVMNSLQIKNLIFSSSATVYGHPKYLPIDETHPTIGVNPYGQSKLFVEHILRDLTVAKSDSLDWNIISLRYFNPVGAHPSGLLGEDPNDEPNNLMPIIAKVAIGKNQYINIFGSDYDTPDGTGVRDYIHVEDLAEGHLSAVNYLSKCKGFEVFNLGTGIGYSVLDIISAYEKASNVKISFKYAARRPGDTASCYASPLKANQKLNWKAKHSLSDMCQSDWLFQTQNNL